MIKKIFTIAIFIAAIATTNAQSLLSKVPSNAAGVIKYGADNFTKNTTLQKIDEYSFVKNNFFRKMRIDSVSSIKEFGINFEKDVYQYVSMQDTSLTFVTLFNLTNAEQFLKVIKANYTSTGKIEKKNGYTFYNGDDKTYFGWNNEMAVIVSTTYQNRKNYYDERYRLEATAGDSLKVVMAENAVMTAPIADAVVEVTEYPVQKKKPVVKGKKPVAKPKTNTAKIQALKKAQKAKEERKWFVRDSIENVKRELFYQQQDLIAKKYQNAVAEKIMITIFNGSINSIENEIKYTKIVEPASHVSMWLDNDVLLNQYTNAFGLGWMYFGGGGYNNYGKVIEYEKDTTAGLQSSVNVYFEKDKMRMEQKTFTANETLAKLSTEVMQSKQSASLLNYVNPDNIGYLSISINTEAMANYYYTVLKKYFNNNSYTGQYADAVNLYVDLVQILIDEKGIADLTPGNYLFVLHDMKNRLVTYTDYEYDKEYNKKEIKKTKNELSPNFTYVFETRKDGFMLRAMNLPLKYAKKEGWNYTAKNGYNELIFKEGDLPISNLYFMVKDGKVVITTSKDVIENTLIGKGFTADEETKAAILNHNYSLKINTKKVLEKIGPELSTNASKKVTDYLIQNFGNVKMESNVKDGMIQSTTTINIKGEHTNSFEFLFDMMDAINNIMEKEKQENEKKIN
jgi:hypothetical protein